jgi:hypothetical protein
MIDVLCGIALVGIGYYLGTKTKVQPKPTELSEEEKRKEQQAKEQWEMLLNFSGKRGGTNE